MVLWVFMPCVIIRSDVSVYLSEIIEKGTFYKYSMPIRNTILFIYLFILLCLDWIYCISDYSKHNGDELSLNKGSVCGLRSKAACILANQSYGTGREDKSSSTTSQTRGIRPSNGLTRVVSSLSPFFLKTEADLTS